MNQLETAPVKAVLEKTPRAQWESFHCEVVRGRSYHATWHFHPEYQLTLVLESRGHRMVGDNITRLRRGDLVLEVRICRTSGIRKSGTEKRRPEIGPATTSDFLMRAFKIQSSEIKIPPRPSTRSSCGFWTRF